MDTTTKATDQSLTEYKSNSQIQQGYKPSPKDIAKIKELYLPKNASDLDVERFIATVKAYGLNPLLGELWCIPFQKWNSETGKKEPSVQIFASRDGFLAIAHRSGMFGGIKTIYNDECKCTTETICKSCMGKVPLIWAETTVWNKSCEHPIKCKVFFDEYTTGQNLWKTKKHVMLGKVAESTALRRAFNISGIYCPEEFKEEKFNNNEVLNSPSPSNVAHASLPEPTNEEKLIDDNDGLPRGNIDMAISSIESCFEIGKLGRLQKALTARSWTPEQAMFLKDAIIKQEEKIVARQQGE